MHAERVSEIIAHFIGLFGTEIEDLRMRLTYDGTALPDDQPAEQPEQAAAKDNFVSGLTMVDYVPDVKYVAPVYQPSYPYAHPHHDHYHERIEGPHGHEPAELPAILRQQEFEPAPVTTAEKLIVDDGPGSEATNLVQVNVVRDDDVLDLTDSKHPPVRDVSDVYDWLAQAGNKAQSLSPISSLQQPQDADGVIKMSDDLHAVAKTIEGNGGVNIQYADGGHYVVTAGNQLDGIHVNGLTVASLPHLDDFMPDRGLASQESEPMNTSGSLHLTGHDSGGSLDITAGANVAANIVSIVDTNVISSVMAVMGDYHSIDAISQVYVYSDNDRVDHGSGVDMTQSAATIGKNIAAFEHIQYQPTSTVDHSSGSDSDPVFPSAWRVSVIDGDVSFTHWTEQYNFLSDNDTMRVTTSGAETTVLSGGNSLVDLASSFNLGMQYNLVIVGGNVYDINAISQVSVLNDNDTVSVGPNAQVQTGGNLLWNMAAITNVGAQDRFTSMPDSMHQTVDNILNKNSAIPDGVAHDPNFAGHDALNVLYITGNFFDVNVIKQVNMVGDSDVVHQVASNLQASNPDATVHVDTGSNALVNIASITDYDSLGHTTYLAGNQYSDAILIQGGLVDHDQPAASQPAHPLANEAIAFLGDHEPATEHDGTIDLGHDLSWHNGAVGDVMQTVTA